MGIISVKKTIGKTDYNYNIITAGAKFSVPRGRRVTVEYEGNSYSAKMHSKTVGRIDGLSGFYKNSGLQIGDGIVLTYDEETDVIKVGTGMAYVFSDMPLEKERKKYTYYESDVSILGIEGARGWEDLCYVSYMKPHMHGCYPAACNEDYVIIERGGKLYIYNRGEGLYRVVAPMLDGKEEIRVSCGGDCTMVGSVFLWSDGEVIYGMVIDQDNDSCQQLVSLKQFSEQFNEEQARIIEMGNFRDEVLWYLIDNSRYGRERKLYLCKNGEIAEIPSQYLSTNVNITATGQTKFLFDGKWIFDILTKVWTPLYDYAFEGLKGRCWVKDCGLEDRRRLAEENVYAVDLETHTVAFYDFPELSGKRYQKDSLVVAKGDQIGRYKNIVRKQDNNNAHLCGNIYKDVLGHEVMVLPDYWLAYKKNDDTLQPLFYTRGCCVPEGFTMVDNHTGVIKVSEDEMAIIDFAKNARYVLDVNKSSFQ